MVRASLIWLNYNSSRFIDIALRSIDSVLNLDFDDYEVVIVDNASTDGSFEVIKKFVEEKKPSSVRVRFVRSDVNRGYAGGMNLGWEARDKDAEYVAFLNNDLIAEPESLRGIIEHMEGDDKIAAANGLIYLRDGKTIYSAGGYATEHWMFGDVCMKGMESECPGLNKLHYVTSADGAYMVVRADVIERVGPQGKPFIDETFLYLDDNLLGLILWNKGYQVIYAPIKAGTHYVGLTTSPVARYYGARADYVRTMLIETRFSSVRALHIGRRYIGYRILCILGKEIFCQRYRGLLDGKKIFNIIRSKLNFTLSLYKAPYVKIPVIEYVLFYLGINKALDRKLFITHEMFTLPPGDFTLH